MVALILYLRVSNLEISPQLHKWNLCREDGT
ncbi:hypothetical protein GDO78_014200 [Eleutherodactylus coqui]|uniref:Uncharacterized protein n=1 Tax=Eleutherodactylus coqui TaxID=57060 RepID=A0A8J6E6X1_ELECQ|nr:hypothetical protein GDO78_014200 [Eleutherodactylus coqui]